MAEETKENEKQLLLDLQQSNEVIDLFGSMQLVNKNTVVDKLVETELTKKGKLRANEMCFYRVKQLSFDEDYPHREAFENVLLSMEELKSPEDKALLMGFILSRLSAFVKAEHRKNHNFKHLTLVEEAHRLLSKVEYGDSGSKKSAVETFTDLLAEVRKYGEGLIIVDQIPNKLASEVLKNTNTKIIHKILAQDDKETVGDTMLMDDKQKEYLSALEVGNAIVFSENTDKPVHVHITAVSDTNEEEIEDEVVRKRFYEKKAFLGTVYQDYDLLQLSGAFNKVCHKMAKLQDDPEMFMDMNKKFNEY